MHRLSCRQWPQPDVFALVRVSHIHLFGLTFVFFIKGLTDVVSVPTKFALPGELRSFLTGLTTRKFLQREFYT